MKFLLLQNMGLSPGIDSRDWYFSIPKSRDWKKIPGLQSLVLPCTTCLPTLVLLAPAVFPYELTATLDLG